MADAAFTTAAFPAYTTSQLRDAIAKSSAPDARMVAEVCRRERALAGDVSVMTQAERLRFVQTGRAR